jgi:serine/threonine protein kinase
MERVLAGRYELEVPLGRGGFGEVWRGTDMATGRPVAIKLVELGLIDDPGVLAETIGRFRREATVVSGLHHPNIVGALDAGRIGNQLFMVMELAPGISLSSMMDERGARGMGLFPAISVLRIAEQVCAGLAAAHKVGVVHRDIKPSNLMVTPSLGIKIIDFGIARLLADNSPRLTMQGHTVGTIAYMSPEQAQGIDVDARTDLYSLGCVLYQLLSGRPPFFSTLPSALLMMQVMDRAVPLGSIRPDLPTDVCQLVSDLMEKERTARPADAGQVISRIKAMREALGDEETEFEADRETFRAKERPDAVSLTRFDSLSDEPSRLSDESNRATILTPERMAQLAAPNTIFSAPPAPPWGPATGQPSQPFRASQPFTPSQPFRPSQPFAGGYPPVPPQPTPIRSAPQASTGAGTGQGPAVPVWPTTPPRRRRSPWPGILSSLITAAIVAGVGAYYWIHTHQALQVTDVKVTAANSKVGCEGTANLIGTITTNGRGGPITYEWVLNGERQGVLKASDGTGSDTVKVTESWAFHGRGTGKDIAELDVITPQSGQSSITFPYSCPQ